MNTAKNTLCLADLEAQTAFELPDRQALSCGIYVVYFDDSFNQYLLNNLTLQQAIQICNIGNNWNFQFINEFGLNDQSNDGNWFKCSIYQESDNTLINDGPVNEVPSLW